MSKYSEITKEDFKRLIEGVCYLIGYSNPPLQQLRLIYDKVKGYDVRDLSGACNDDDVLKELARKRNLCWPTLQDGIRRYQVKRLEAENSQRKKEEKKAFDEKMPAEVKALLRKILKDK